MATTSPTETLSLIIDEGQVLQLPAPATSVFVANPEIADVQVKSGSVLYIFGRAPGQTSFYAVDAEDNIVASRTLVVGFNFPAMRSAIRQLTGDDRVRVSQVQDMIMLSGAVDSATMAQDVVRVAARYLPRSSGITGGNVTAMDDVARAFILNRLQIAGSNQVNIRVRLAEVNREAIKTLGIGTDVANPNLFGDVDMSFGFDPNVSLTGAAATAALGTSWGATTITTALDALVEDGQAVLLAEPNLTALSGETASFLAGGEFPIPVPDGDGAFAIEFREYGVRLSFTPTVVNGNRISMRVRPEVSERDESIAIDFGGGIVPGLTTRRAETSVEMGSGQSFAIAGLLRNNSSQSISKFPGLGDVPVLGALFRSDRFLRQETELVIVVTPYLVKPINSSQVALPNDGYVAPNDIDRWLNGRFNSEAPTPPPVTVSRPASNVGADGGLVGDVGFVVQ
jgi:pilus assembly protein CpaC